MANEAAVSSLQLWTVVVQVGVVIGMFSHRALHVALFSFDLMHSCKS